MSCCSNISSFTWKQAEIDTRTLPRIDGSSRDAEIRKFRINNWFRWEGITTDIKNIKKIELHNCGCWRWHCKSTYEKRKKKQR